MKALFFFLLFANILVFLYALGHPSESRSVQSARLSYIDPELPTIQLASEVPVVARVTLQAEVVGEVKTEPTDQLTDAEPASPGGLAVAEAVDSATVSTPSPGLMDAQNNVEPKPETVSSDAEATTAVPQVTDQAVDNEPVDAPPSPSVTGSEPVAESKPKPKPELEPELEPVSICFRAAYFKTRRAAQKALQLVRNTSDSARIEAEDSKVEVGYWVLYPAAETLAASRANLKMLQNRGLKDLWFFEKGPFQGAISLGWFKVESYAAKAQERFLKKGLKVEMQAKSVLEKRYVLIFERPGSVAEQETLFRNGRVKLPVDFKLTRFDAC